LKLPINPDWRGCELRQERMYILSQSIPTARQARQIDSIFIIKIGLIDDQ
jgi:hypothetical protein